MPSTHPGYAIRMPRPDELDEVRALMIRVIQHDYGYDYRSRWHDDVDDPAGFYLEHPRQTLLVAVDDRTGRILGTAGVRVLRITSPPHPAEIPARYDRERTAELTRVFVQPEARRRGIGRALVDAARRWVADVGGYDLIQLHSRTAVEFWRAMPTTEILDTRRPGVAGPEAGQVYFEM
jgi:GNAT superfamily N-acetyltransferase